MTGWLRRLTAAVRAIWTALPDYPDDDEWRVM